MNPQGQPSLMSQLSATMASGGSPMNVQTPGSPTYDPSLQTGQALPTPANADTVPSQAMQGGQAMQGQNQMITLPVNDADPQAQGTQVPFNEMEGLIKAISGRIDNLSKMQRMWVEAHLPPRPQGV